MSEPVLTDEQRAEWADITTNAKMGILNAPKPGQPQMGSLRLNVQGLRSIVAVAERLTFLESSTVALRAELAQARAEQRRGEEALRDEIEELQGWHAQEIRKLEATLTREADDQMVAAVSLEVIRWLRDTGVDDAAYNDIDLRIRLAIRQGIRDHISAVLSSSDAPTREGER